METKTLRQMLTYYEGQINTEVPGWLFAPDIAIIFHLAAAQSHNRMQGDFCEVGVYLGKSAILLSHLRTAGENLYLFDSFDYQPDQWELANRNLRKFSPAERIHFAKTDTITLNPATLGFERKLRMLHIDANHDHPYVLKELGNFCPHLQDSGILVLDDACNPEYPGVLSALVEFCLSSVGCRWRPFAIGGNKIYLSQRQFLATYQKLLLESGIFQAMTTATVLDVDILLCKSQFPKPLATIKSQLLKV